MITSTCTRNEVKQILQIIYQDEEITEEMIDYAIVEPMEIPIYE